MAETERKSVKIVRRWGSHQPGETVEVDEPQAGWLVGNSFAEDPQNPGTSRHNAHAPGENGPDPRAGGDVSRWRMTGEKKGSRVGERAGRVAGAPKPAGDVSHVASENLGREHKDNPGDVLTASGKTLREVFEDDQREIDERERKTSRGAQSDEGSASRESNRSDEGQPSGTQVKTGGNGK